MSKLLCPNCQSDNLYWNDGEALCLDCDIWITPTPWVVEHRDATVEEWTSYCRSLPHSCKEYEACYPMSEYHGACYWFIREGRKHCGKAFIPVSNCQSGLRDKE